MRFKLFFFLSGQSEMRCINMEKVFLVQSRMKLYSSTKRNE